MQRTITIAALLCACTLTFASADISQVILGDGSLLIQTSPENYALFAPELKRPELDM